MITQDWQKTLANVITDPAELLALLALEDKWLEPAKKASQLFPLRVPRDFVARMQKGKPFDPLLRQILPLDEELNDVAGFVKDPLQEAKANPLPGVVHKYHDRVLVTLAGSCAVNCRYCFRRHFPYAENTPGQKGIQNILDYLKTKLAVSEVILSGGDPLLTKDELLEKFIKQLANIQHIRRLRVHTRLPVVLPERVTDGLISAITATRLQPVIVIHANHAQEISDSVVSAIKQFRQHGITVFNQSVLLKGVNDDANSLAELSNALFDAGVIPYYLHVLDKVSGTAHFDVPEGKAKQIMQKLRQKLPGYLVPRLVREVPGELSKQPL